MKALAGRRGRRTLTFRSPAGGIVLEKKALQGMRFMPGEALYQIADLSRVWVIADVFEQDLGRCASGSTAQVAINAYPGQDLRRQDHLHLPDAQAGDAHGPGPHRTRQSGGSC